MTIDELAAIAVLGAGRADSTRVDLPAPVRAAIASVAPPAHLLAAAAAMGQFERAGALPSAFTEPPLEACPADPRAPATGNAAAVIRRVIEQDRDVLPECLDLVIQADMTVPHDLVPALLALAYKKTVDVTLVLRAAGRRGSWLASLHPQWSSSDSDAVTPENSVERWQTGDRATRKALLASVRASDPARAIDLIRSTWEEDGHEERAAFVEQLRIGLSMQDEAFLEAALDDGRKPVRQAAANLLAMLPESALVARMTARAQAMVQVTKGRVSAEPPEQLDAAARRDGIDARAFAGLGSKAAILARVVARVPPSTWTGDPARLLAAARKSDWHHALVRGWCDAAVRFGDDAWAQVLMHGLKPGDVEAQMLQDQLARLIPCLRLDDATALKIVVQRAAKDATFCSLVVRAAPRPWSAAFSQEAMWMCLRHIQQAEAYDLMYATSPPSQVATWTTRFAHPGCLDDLRTKFDSVTRPEADKIRSACLATIDLRHAMHKELS